MKRLQYWAMHISVLITGIVLLNACESSGQSDKSLDSEEWLQFKTLVMRYDSMSVAFQKREKEDPAFAADPQGTAGAEIQQFYALTQQLNESVPEGIKDMTDVTGYRIDDLRTLRLAAAIGEAMEPFMAINKELIKHVADPDSVLDLKLEIAQIAVMTGDPATAKEYATDDVIAHAQPMNRAALFTGLAQAALENDELDDARNATLKAVGGYTAAVKEELAKENGDPQIVTYAANRSGTVLAGVMYALKENNDTAGMEKLTADAQAQLLPEMKWEDVQSFMTAEMDKIAEERAALDKPAAPWADHAWIGSEALSVEKLKGKVVLVDFFATWCKPCIMAFPHLREWKEKYEDDGLVVVGLTTYQGQYEGAAVDPAAEMTKLKEDFIPKHDITWPVGVEKNGRQTMQDYNVTGIPHVVLIDRAGRVQYVKVGATDYQKTERKIQQMLAE
ncbi:MAG: TlpA family protein disulfide reductase [Bacteroidetes bacterium]|nr:TlpA family protein disulfide reductase [Bacteroidota bacterium]